MLRQFFEMRKGLSHTALVKQEISKVVKNTSLKELMKPQAVNLQQIIDKKPPPKEVLKYLRERNEEIEEELRQKA